MFYSNKFVHFWFAFASFMLGLLIVALYFYTPIVEFLLKKVSVLEILTTDNETANGEVFAIILVVLIMFALGSFVLSLSKGFSIFTVILGVLYIIIAAGIVNLPIVLRYYYDDTNYLLLSVTNNQRLTVDLLVVQGFLLAFVKPVLNSIHFMKIKKEE